jgi:hypothetical protein
MLPPQPCLIIGREKSPQALVSRPGDDPHFFPDCIAQIKAHETGV